MPFATTILQLEIEPRTAAQLGNRRRRQGKNKTVAHLLHHRASDPSCDRSCIRACGFALRPVFERDKAQTHILPLPREAKARNRHHIFHLGLLHGELLHGLNGFERALLRRTGR